MDKCIRKCKLRIEEIAQVSVRTRKRALATTPVAAESSCPAKISKVGGVGLEFSSSSSLVQFNRQNSVSPAASDDQCSSPSSDHIPAFSCSSTMLLDEELKFPDLEEEESVEIENLTYDSECRERRETTPLSELREETDELESTAKPAAANSRRQSTAEKMPSETELDEFFAVAEKDIQKKFTDKYNFDIGNDKPLEGRYEWVRLKP